MPWTKPDFVEISLCMEVTGYVNTDEAPVAGRPLPVAKDDEPGSSSLTTDN